MQQYLLQILFIWSRRNPDTSYRQGMHELAGPMLYVVNRDLGPSSADPVMLCATSFALFDSLMRKMKQWYETGEYVNQSSSKMEIHEKRLFRTSPSPNSPINTTALMRKCLRIQNQCLRSVDEIMWHKLIEYQIEPQLYGIRWVKLLFGREVSLEQLIPLWTRLFQDAQDDWELLDWFAVCILLNNRDKVLEATDEGSIMMLLLKPVEINDPISLVLKAQEFKVNYSEKSYGYPLHAPNSNVSSVISSRVNSRSASPSAAVPSAPSKARQLKQTLGSYRDTAAWNTVSRDFFDGMRKSFQPVLKGLSGGNVQPASFKTYTTSSSVFYDRQEHAKPKNKEKQNTNYGLIKPRPNRANSQPIDQELADRPSFKQSESSIESMKRVEIVSEVLNNHADMLHNAVENLNILKALVDLELQSSTVSSRRHSPSVSSIDSSDELYDNSAIMVSDPSLDAPYKNGANTNSENRKEMYKRIIQIVDQVKQDLDLGRNDVTSIAEAVLGIQKKQKHFKPISSPSEPTGMNPPVNSSPSSPVFKKEPIMASKQVSPNLDPPRPKPSVDSLILAVEQENEKRNRTRSKKLQDLLQ